MRKELDGVPQEEVTPALGREEQLPTIGGHRPPDEDPRQPLFLAIEEFPLGPKPPAGTTRGVAAPTRSSLWMDAVVGDICRFPGASGAARNTVANSRSSATAVSAATDLSPGRNTPLWSPLVVSRNGFPQKLTRITQRRANLQEKHPSVVAQTGPSRSLLLADARTTQKMVHTVAKSAMCKTRKSFLLKGLMRYQGE